MKISILSYPSLSKCSLKRVFRNNEKSIFLLIYKNDENIFLFLGREQELFNHHEEYNVFFDHLIALVAESIAQIPVSGEFKKTSS